MKKWPLVLAISAMAIAGAASLVQQEASPSTQVKATEGTHVGTWSALKDAVKSASEGQVFVLDADIVSGGGGSDRIKIDGKNLTIDLNGFSVNRNREKSDTNGHVFEIQGNSSVAITNSSAETSTITGGYAEHGGAINVHEGSSLAVTNVKFSNNRASVDGGAIYNRGHLTLDHCLIESCYASDTGGAIYNTDTGWFELNDTAINSCHAKNDGGAINMKLKKECTIRGSSFTSNYSDTEDGGAISIDDDKEVLSIYDSSFNDNHTATKGYGGAIEVENGTLKLHGVTFNRNQARKGGAVYFDGGDGDQFLIDNVGFAQDSVTSNTVFNANVATEEGGAVYSDDSTLNFTNAEFTKNSAGDYAGAILLDDGTLNLTTCTFSENEAKTYSGGAVYIHGKGTMNLNGGSFTENVAAEYGGAFTVKGGSDNMKIQGALTINNNFCPNGPDVYLPDGTKLVVTGSLSGSSISVTRHGRTGKIATGFATTNPDVDPSSIFVSVDAFTIATLDGDNVNFVDYVPATDPKLLAPFVSQQQQVNRGERPITSANWLSGISGERYLNEINLPGTHDTAMRKIGIEAGKGTAFKAMNYKAITQKRYIPEQFEEGVRYTDIRVHNRWCEYHWYKNDLHDDGENLWQTHGKSGTGGTYWACDENENLINLNMVLEYARSFLIRNPSEFIIMGFTCETYRKYENPIIRERLGTILTKFMKDNPVNPSTGNPFIYTQDGDLATPYTYMPQLKEVRGMILIETEEVNNGEPAWAAGGFEDYKTLSNISSCRGASGGRKVWDDEKIENVNKFFAEDRNKIALPTDAGTWENAGQMFKIGLNCSPENSVKYPNESPLWFSDRVLPGLFDDPTGAFYDIKGKYIGWIKTDGATGKEWGKIWESNFSTPEGNYVTITVDPNLDGGSEYKVKTYTVVKNTHITIPYFNYAYDQVANTKYFQGWKVGENTVFTGTDYVATENVTFQAMWADEPNGSNGIAIDVKFRDCDNADALRPSAVTLRLNGDTNVDLTSANQWHIVHYGAVSSIVPQVWAGIDGLDADAANKYKYTVSGNPAEGYVLTFVHTSAATLDNIAGSILWSDEDDYDKYRPNTVDLTVALKDGDTELDTATFAGNREVKDWDYTLGNNLPKYRDGELIDYAIVVKNDGAWGWLSEYNFIQDGYNLVANHKVSGSDLSVSIRWADNGDAAKARPADVHVHIKADGVQVADETIVAAYEGDSTWYGNYLVKTLQQATVYNNNPETEERTAIAYTIEITDADGNAIPGYEAHIDSDGDNNFDVVLAYGDYDLSAVNAVEAKLIALGNETVAYNATFINKMEEARAAYDALSDDDKELVLHLYYVLENAEREFDQNFGTLYDIDKEILEVVPTLDTLSYGERTEALNNLGREILDLEEAERALLLNLSIYNAALTRFGNIQIVINSIDSIGDVTVTSECENKIAAAKASYAALSAEDKALVDNYDDLILSEAEYFAMYFLQETGAKCSVGPESDDHSAGLSLIWSGLSDKWEALSDDAKTLLVAGTGEDSLADFLARYTHIVQRYGQSYAFTNGPVVQPATGVYEGMRSNDSEIALISILFASTAVAGVALVLNARKRKRER